MGETANRYESRTETRTHQRLAVTLTWRGFVLAPGLLAAVGAFALFVAIVYLARRPAGDAIAVGVVAAVVIGAYASAYQQSRYNKAIILSETITNNHTAEQRPPTPAPVINHGDSMVRRDGKSMIRLGKPYLDWTAEQWAAFAAYVRRDSQLDKTAFYRDAPAGLFPNAARDWRGYFSPLRVGELVAEDGRPSADLWAHLEQFR